LTRRLTTILAADVVGFSRLMSSDETGTLAYLKAFRAELVEPKTLQYGGRVVKLMGDGALMEFGSVVDAVNFAADVQRSVADHADSLPEERRVLLRIGINIGDIIVEGDDIYGNGVNIAARLEKLAEPGGICISRNVYDQVKGNVDLAFEDAGARKVKNIPEPVQVYRVQLGLQRPREQVQPYQTAQTAATLHKPSIAVLPFTNMSGEPDQEYFADGLTEDLISTLGRCRWLLVIARNSMFAYKGTSIDVRRVAEELGVRYVLEGSVRRSGHRIRVTVELIGGRDGARLWGERYDRDIDDIFELQDQITAAIAGTIEPELEAIEEMASRGRPTDDLNAWDCYQRGLWHLYHFTMEALETSKTLLERAIVLDPNFSQAYARLAYVHIQFGWYGPKTERAGRVNCAASLAKQAVQLDRRDPAARVALGRALALCGAIESGVEELRTSVLLDPSFAQGHYALAQALCGLDRDEEAMREVEIAIQLSPRDPQMWTFLHIRTLAYYIAGNLDQAEVSARAAMRQPNVTIYPHIVMVAILGRNGKTVKAKNAIAELHRLRPGFSCKDAVSEWYFGEHAVMTQRFLDQFTADLRNSGLPE
jgi:TolB-like protein/class 3 adenylate cyclase/Flp pilus assembly protein TadD